MHSRLGSATVSQLAFRGESNPNFLREKSQWDNTVVQKINLNYRASGVKKRTNCVSWTVEYLLTVCIYLPWMNRIQAHLEKALAACASSVSKLILSQRPKTPAKSIRAIDRSARLPSHRPAIPAKSLRAVSAKLLSHRPAAPAKSTRTVSARLTSHRPATMGEICTYDRCISEAYFT